MLEGARIVARRALQPIKYVCELTISLHHVHTECPSNLGHVDYENVARPASTMLLECVSADPAIRSKPGEQK